MDKIQNQAQEQVVQLVPWRELGVLDKLERLREALLQQREHNQAFDSRLRWLERQGSQFEHHQHGADGTVLIRPRDTDRGYGMASQGGKPAFDPLA